MPTPTAHLDELGTREEEQAREDRGTGGSVERFSRELESALAEALPLTSQLEGALLNAQSGYKRVAEVLVELRHLFRGPNGEQYDLQGRSAGYRQVVRDAYARAGADPSHSISKRLTVGASYWVRKFLLERYGEERLVELGVIRSRTTPQSIPLSVRLAQSVPVDRRPEEIVGLLNWFASEPGHAIDEELIRAATRALLILKERAGAS